MNNIISSCLLVNSNPEDQAIFAAALGDVSPQTICMMADDGGVAIDIMQQEDIVPDYIFVEMNMPGVDGIKFLKLMKDSRLLRNVPVIVHCLSPEKELVAGLKRAGAYAIYPLPYKYLGVCNLLTLCFQERPVRICMN